MTYYASVTAGVQNISAMRRHGHAQLISPVTARMWRKGWRYAVDNGAWTAHQQGTAFDFAAFGRIVETYAAAADWVIAPDVVANADATLTLAAEWVPRLIPVCRLVLIAAQDGMTYRQIRDISPAVGVALGGSTEWKEAAMRDHQWRQAPYLHVLRVNTRHRMSTAKRLGADSCDGTSATRFSANSQRIATWRDSAVQEALW